MAQQQKNPYDFPILKYDHILECLEQLNITANLEELKHPSPPLVCSMMEQFVFRLMGESREDMRQPKFDAVSLIEFPDLHEESLPEFTFIHKW